MITFLTRVVKGRLFVLFAIFAFSACTYEQIAPQEITVPDNVSFSTDVQPIFDASCNTTGCHNAGGIPPDLSPANAWVSLVYFNYLDTVTTENSVLWKKIDTGSMKKYATNNDRAIIFQWIEQDAPDN